MSSTLQDSFRWVMTQPGSPLVRETAPLPVPGAGEVVVRVAGCGVCHTDLDFQRGGVRTRHPLPLALGHEIAGHVEQCSEGTEEWLGRPVVVPAVLPCGACAACGAGRETSCRAQRMPGNDFHGGFASHVVVPARWLVDAADLPPGLPLEDLAVLADAVTTPYQAMVRGRVGPGDAVVVLGAGGIGSFGVQIARSLGARVVAADIDPEKCHRAGEFGAEVTVTLAGLDPRQAREAVREACGQAEFPELGVKVFEMSGSPEGQLLAWSLLGPAGVLAVVGYTIRRIEIRLSNLMAFDAEAFGNWGCRPQLYAPALDLVRRGEIQVRPFVRQFPMAEINEVLDAVHEHRLRERPVLVP